MPKSYADAEHRRRVLTAERDRLDKEVRRLELELFRSLPTLFEDDVNARKNSIAAYRKELGKLDRRLNRRDRTEAIDPQIVMFE